MFNLPFDRAGQFYRGNLHCHSHNSDGRLPPEDVVAAYRDQGYDFIALTDHFLERFGFQITDTRHFRDASFTTLLGAELHAPALASGQTWHMVSVGLPLDFAPVEPHETGAALAKRAAKTGAFVGLAHPAWYGVTIKDALTIKDAHAIEIFNTGHSRDSDRGDSWYLCDVLATQGHRYSAYAADDAHFGDRPDRFGGWVMVKAEELTPEALLDSLKTGDFYSSQGPTIEHVAIENDTIQVECSPAASIHAVGRPPTNRYVIGDGLTAASFPIDPFAGHFFRITVIDERGRRAWTNPIWLDGFGAGVGVG